MPASKVRRKYELLAVLTSSALEASSKQAAMRACRYSKMLISSASQLTSAKLGLQTASGMMAACTGCTTREEAECAETHNVQVICCDSVHISMQ